MKLEFEDWYQDFLDTQFAYHLAISTMYADQNTIAPKKGAPIANEAMAILQREAFLKASNPEIIEKIKEYQNRLPEDSLERMEVERRIEEIEDQENIPADVIARISKNRFDAGSVWHQAKEKSDYEMFKPYLMTTVADMKETLRYSPRYKEGEEYNMMLDAFEKGMDQKQYDAFFDVIRTELPPLIEKIQNKKQIDDSFLNQEVDIKVQEEFNKKLLQFMQADEGKVYLSTTEHPFTSFLSANDMRITTHYYPDRFLSALLSTVHEYGHALYGLQMDPAFARTSLISSVGSAAHESQSRFLENHIGRSEAFWKALYPALSEVVPSFKEIDAEDLVKMINVSRAGLIRTEADELTYPLHILIRYEIEKEMVKDDFDFDSLPQLWADKYEQYLGIRPENDKEGVLQDMHWSSSYLGYFPTYALGSAYAAQLYEAMEQEIDVEEALLKGDFHKITSWQKENIHQYAGSKSMKEIVEEVSGKPFDPHIYTNYLKKKYTKLYNLDENSLINQSSR